MLTNNRLVQITFKIADITLRARNIMSYLKMFETKTHPFKLSFGVCK